MKAQKSPSISLQAMCEEGLALHVRGRLEEASNCYKKVLRRDPKHFDALHLLGTIFVDTRQTELGVALIRRAIAVDPNVAGVHSNLGKALNELKRHDDALARCDAAIRLQPDFVDAHSNRGIALRELKRFDEALASFDRAIALNPMKAEAHNNRGTVLEDLAQMESALASFEQAIALKPDYAEAHANRGAVLRALKRPEDALASYSIAIRLRPDYAKAFHNRGIALCDLNRAQDALASFDKALAVSPHYADSHIGRGLLLHELLRHDEALASYDRALALQPNHAAAQLNRSFTLLRMGNLEAGWRQYQSRSLEHTSPAHQYDAGRLWLGTQNIKDKTIFVYYEQGFGDTIQFSRYIFMLQALGSKTTLSVQNSLEPLFMDFSGPIEVVGRDERPDHFDYHCPLLSLPLAFRTTLDSIPLPQGYLAADDKRRAHFRDKLGPKVKPRIGLAWSGNPTHENDHNRSLTFEQLLPLLAYDAEWIALQNEIRLGDRAEFERFGGVSFHGSDLKDFGDTAALLDLMDLVITVDTSVAHLAGAMGKPAWILLPFSPDWRWLLGRRDSPWYTSARLFRQPRQTDWASVIEDVKADLHAWEPEAFS